MEAKNTQTNIALVDLYLWKYGPLQTSHCISIFEIDQQIFMQLRRAQL